MSNWTFAKERDCQFEWLSTFANQNGCLWDVVGGSDGDSLGGLPDLVADKMRVERGRLDLAVSEQLAETANLSPSESARKAKEWRRP